MKSKRGSVLIRAGMLLVLAAAALTGYNLFEGYMAGRASNEAIRFLEPMIVGEEATAAPQISFGFHAAAANPIIIPPEYTEPTEPPVQPEATVQPTQEAVVKPTPLPPVEIPDYVLSPRMEMPVVHYDGQDYIGLLEIPILQLKIPVISEWNYPRLKIAPCRYVGSAYTNDLVIAAHNYQSHFGRINELKPGNTVLFTDVDGNVFKYEVILKETLNPTDIREMTNAEFDLTMFTCTVGGSYRVTVRCDLAYGYPRYVK